MEWPRWYKSEEDVDEEELRRINEETNPLVWKLVGNTFNEHALDNELDVIVMYHTTEGACENCEVALKLHSDFASFVRKHYPKQVEHVRFATLNVGKNDADEYLTRLPAMVLYPAHIGKDFTKGVRFDAGVSEDMEEFVEFLEDNAYWFTKGKEEL